MTDVFGHMPDGTAVHRLTLADGPLTAAVLTLGAALQDVRLAGVDHRLALGFPTLAPYLGPFPHAGTIMGPVANRIKGARAVIDSQTHQFDANFLGAHTLHGGSAATHAQVWRIEDHGPSHATLSLALPDDQGGFQGNRQITARFHVTGTALTLTLEATTDAPTLMNLANHSYWNLGPQPTTMGHMLTVHADRYLPSDPDTILPSGDIASVAGTRFDYRTGRAIRAGAEGLLDHNLCLSDARVPLRPVAQLTGPTGITMEMSTTEPGLQVFDGHVLGASATPTNDGQTSQAYAALALEAQFWPDAPNNLTFPDITLRPGDAWRQVTGWRFLAPSSRP